MKFSRWLLCLLSKQSRLRCACVFFAAFVAFGFVVTPAVAADPIPGEDYCNRVVASIRFVGNDVTRPQVLLREIVQKMGAQCSLDDIIDGIQNIQDLGLFKSVRAELDLVDGLLELRYIVDEKIFILPIPRFSRTSDGELRAGLQIRWENFLGRLHRLKLTSEKRQEDDGQGRSGFVHSARYTVPRFLGTDYGLLLGVSTERRNVELEQDDVIYGESERRSVLFETQVARWLNESKGVRGLKYYGGFRIIKRNYNITSGEAGPFSDGTDLSFVFGAENQLVRRDAYRRRGLDYGFTVRIADESLASSFSYRRLDLWSAWYLPLLDPQKNLNIQLRLGLSDGAPFGEHTYTVGGGDLIRGVETGKDTGDVMMLLNVEYLSGFFSYPAWRWVGFLDAGNVFDKDDVDILNQNVRVGLGLRYKLQSLANTDLRLDLAWDPDRSKIQPYFATRLTF